MTSPGKSSIPKSVRKKSIGIPQNAGSEMAALISAYDWSQTPLGPMPEWPQSLLTAVSICLFSRFPMFVWWGPERINIYNDAYRPVLGASKHPQALGRPAYEVWSEIWDIIGPMADSVLHDGKSTWSENQKLLMDRFGFTEETYFTFSYSPIFDEAGKVGGMFTAVQETTKQVLADRRLKILYDLSMVADDGKNVDEACRLAAEVLSRYPADIPFALLYLTENNTARLAASTGVPPDSDLYLPTIPLDSDSPWSLAQVCAAGESVQISDLESRFQRIPLSIWSEAPRTALALPIGGSVGFLVVGISPRLALDSEYSSFCDLLAGNVTTTVANARIADAERKRTEALAELDRAKIEFFSNVSHEFRTPLTLMLGPVQDLIGDEALTAAQHENLNIIHRSSLRLLKLVNTLLDFARIQSNRIQASYEATDLAALTGDLASNFRSAVERAGLKLIVDCPPLPELVYVDRDMWEKIVLNLLSNAFKFTFKGEIVISLEAVGQEAQLSIRDTGIGIAQENLALIFERFQRVQGAEARTNEGSGIGLSLVAELVRFHGGQVTVSSVPGVGSTFTVSIPFGSAHLPQEQINAKTNLMPTTTGAYSFLAEAMQWALDDAESRIPDEVAENIASEIPLIGTPGLNKRARILIADDNADMRSYLKRLLEQRYHVETTRDGFAALQLVIHNPPDLILADVMMPNIDGFGLLHQIRTNPDTRVIPIILLSARAGEEARIDGLTAGADDYIVKPFSARELIARIDAQLQMTRLRYKVRESTATVENIIETITDPFYILDRNSCFLYINSRAEAVFRTSREELIGKNVWEVFPQTVNSQAYNEVQQAIETQKPRSFETLSTVTNTWVEVNVYPSSQGVVVYFRDISERKETDRLRERLEMVVSNIDGGFILIDQNFRMIYVNHGAGERAARVKGINREAMTGMTVDEAFPEITNSRLSRELHRAMTEQIAMHFEEYIEPYKLWSEYRIYPFAGDLAVFTTDITERKRIESALQETEERLRLVMDSATDYAIYALDTEGHIYSWSAGAERVFGFQRDEVIGKHVEILYLPEDRANGLPVREMQRAISLGFAENERWLMRKDGSRFFASGMVRLIHDSSGNFRGFARVSRDATERELIAQERERLTALLDEERQRLASVVANVPGIIWESRYDPEKQAAKMQFISAYVESLLGYTVDEVMAIPNFWDSIMLPDDFERVNEIMEQIRYAGGTRVLYYRVSHKEGHVVHLENHVTVIPDNVKGRYVRGVVMDISERQRFAQAQARYAKMLSQSNEELQQFAYIASHDLQEPLRMVTSYLQLLEKRYADKLDSDAREFIDFAVDGAARMRELITALLSYSRVESGEKTFQEFPSQTALDTALSNLALKIEDGGAVITQDEMPNIKADPLQITQLFQNLINNALKFHGDDPPRIHVGVMRQGHEWRFSVRDNGIGIPENSRDRIFQIFQRLNRDLYPGSGIGLAICKKVVERHKGRIWFESTPGEGTTFYFTIPV